MRRLAFAAVSLAFLATACQPATTELTEEQKAAIADTVMRLSAESAAAWDSQDSSRFYSYFADWSAFPMAGCPSLDAYRSDIASFWPRFSSWTSDQREIRTLVLGPDAVALEGRQVAAVTDTAGTSGEWITIYSELWVRGDTGWKILFYKFYNLEVPDLQ